MRYSALWILLPACMAVCGCSNTLEVTVDRIRVDSDVPYNIKEHLDIPVRHSVILAIEALEEAKQQYPIVMEAVQQQSKTPLASANGKKLSEIESLIARGHELLNSMPGEADADLSLLRTHIIKSRVFVEKAHQAISDWNLELRQQIDTHVSRNAQNSPAELKIQLARPQTLITRAAEPLQFGGFQARSIHTISPHDPEYARLLGAKVSAEPFSSVRTHAAGDSTIMFVQESPTQMRVFSVDMEGTVMAQNIMLISDKALQAAVNYLSPVPVGN